MLFRLIFILSIILFIDFYAFQSVRVLTSSLDTAWRRGIRLAYWSISLIVLLMLVMALTGQLSSLNKSISTILMGLFFAFMITKLLMMLPMLLEDIYRIFHKVYSWIVPSAAQDNEAKGLHLISRKKFISQVGTGLGGLAFLGFTYGVVRGAHNYKIHRRSISLKNLPPAFKGLKIAHLSDIHTGSFWDKNAVAKGIQKVLNEKPDVIFFTGDLVNSLADELTEDYIALFSQLKAPMGVHSILGNHDYGDYHNWPDRVNFVDTSEVRDHSHMSPMQLANLQKLMDIQKRMGWNLMLNQNTWLERDGQRIALIGLENYGARGTFPKYGKLNEAIKGVEDAAVKILLSHDPSHWDSEVNSNKIYQDIQLTLAGHTHGAQFGIETEGFKWSPIKYMYKQWADLYEESNGQKLYVNRGFGYLGYPGRLGIRPEIGILTLV